MLCVQDALQQRMTAQESSVLQLKQELLRTSMNRDELTRQNVSVCVCVEPTYSIIYIDVCVVISVCWRILRQSFIRN